MPMSRIKNIVPLCAGGAFLLMSLDLGIAKEENPGAGYKTTVDKVSVENTGKGMTLHVSAKGNQYDTLDTKTFSASYSGGATCKVGRDVHYYEAAISGGNSGASIFGKKKAHQSIGIYTDEPIKWDTDSGKKSIAVSNRTLSGPVHPKLEMAALAKCNSEAQKIAKQQKISLSKAMSETRQFDLGYSWLGNARLEAWTVCGKPRLDGGLLPQTWLSVITTPPKVKVTCMAKPHQPGMVNVLKPGKLDTKFAVTNLNLKSDTVQYTGTCPKTVKLTVTIKVNKPGSVQYKWKIGTASSIAKPLKFAENKTTRSLTRSFDLSKTGVIKGQFVTTGEWGSKTSNTVDISITCKYPV